MFGNIGSLEVTNSNFNNAAGDQYNYNLGNRGTKSAAALGPPPVVMPPALAQTASAPAVPVVSSAQHTVRQSTELSPSQANARMFGDIGQFRANNSTFNNAAGNQTNVNYTDTSPEQSDTAALTGVLPTLGRPEQPGKLHKPHNPFWKLTHPNQSTSTSNPAPIPAPNPLINHPFKPPPNPSGGLNHVDTALAVGDSVMTLLQTAALLSNVPGLSQAASMVLTIFQSVKGAKDNQDDFMRLANHACNLVSSVALIHQRRSKEGRELPPELVENLEILVGKLKPIEKFLTDHHERRGFRGNMKRMMLHKAEASQVLDHREKLTQALAEFGLRSNIGIQDGVAQLDKRFDDLVDALERMVLQGSHSQRELPGSQAGEPVSHLSPSENPPVGQTPPQGVYQTTPLSPPGFPSPAVYNHVGGSQYNQSNYAPTYGPSYFG